MPELLELQLTAMGHGGSALGRHAGRVVFVPYAIPGETVRAEVVETHERWARARLVEVLDPSTDRVVPPCPYFGPELCGGCQFQHIAYEAAAELKRQVVIDQLARVGGLDRAPVGDILAAEVPWGYRNHARFSLTEGGRLGYPTADGQGVIPVDECRVLDPQLLALWDALDVDWPQLRHLGLRCGSATGDLMAVFEPEEYQDFDIEVDLAVSCVLLLDGEPAVMMGNPYLTEWAAGREYRISAGSPFKVSTSGAGAQVALVAEALTSEGHETLVDLYCGVGLFGLALARRMGKVIGIEASRGAAADWRYNAQGSAHVELVEGTAEEVLPRIDVPVDLLVLDPPRTGVGRLAIQAISRLGPGRIAYVSGDPATLARDARLLVDAGYALDSVQPVDLAPQTCDVEAVALFSR